MHCPGCGAPIHPEEDSDSLVCDHCKGVYVPEKNEDEVRVLGEKSALLCPVCAIPLEHAAMNHHRIQYCTHCRGSLVAMETFVALVNDLRTTWGHAPDVRHPPDPNAIHRRILCPQCQQPMDTHFYCGPGNVVIDDCSHCHFNWLDAGELRSIVSAPDHSYTADSRAISDYRAGWEN